MGLRRCCRLVGHVQSKVSVRVWVSMALEVGGVAVWLNWTVTWPQTSHVLPNARACVYFACRCATVAHHLELTRAAAALQ